MLTELHKSSTNVTAKAPSFEWYHYYTHRVLIRWVVVTFHTHLSGVKTGVIIVSGSGWAVKDEISTFTEETHSKSPLSGRSSVDCKDVIWDPKQVSIYKQLYSDCTENHYTIRISRRREVEWYTFLFARGRPWFANFLVKTLDSRVHCKLQTTPSTLATTVPQE